MPDKSDPRPRLSVRITQDTYNKLREYVPHGAQTELYQAITDDLIEVFEQYPDRSRLIIAAVIEGELDLVQHIVRSEGQREDGETRVGDSDIED